MPILNIELSDDAIELLSWERKVIVPAHQRLAANPSSAISLAQVEKALELRRAQRLSN